MNNRSRALLVDLEAWCGSYVAAFERFEVKAIGAHWAFPALIISGRHQLVMSDQAAFDNNTDGLVGFYKRQKVAKVERKVLRVEAMGEKSVAMQVEDMMSTASGAPIEGWRSAYVLRQTRGGWRAVLADATGEAKAWAARGTPLGS